ncbi:hypothetical protein ACTXNW_08560 [Enterococcus malodoratus]|uniref:hypothetical protein n=1 Tax=Enterococcus malodoratus TaxID=71451 RepID=UPI003FD6A118
MNGKTCALCGEPIPDALKARASEITTGKINGEVFSFEPLSVNEILLGAAIEFLHDIDSEKIETIQFNSAKHDDRSRDVTIKITYPPELTELEKQVNYARSQIERDKERKMLCRKHSR